MQRKNKSSETNAFSTYGNFNVLKNTKIFFTIIEIQSKIRSYSLANEKSQKNLTKLNIIRIISLTIIEIQSRICSYSLANEKSQSEESFKNLESYGFYSSPSHYLYTDLSILFRNIGAILHQKEICPFLD